MDEFSNPCWCKPTGSSRGVLIGARAAGRTDLSGFKALVLMAPHQEEVTVFEGGNRGPKKKKKNSASSL